MNNERRFGGIARLYGQQALQRFSYSHVAVIGVGGVGSWAVEALARSGIGALTLYDLDHVAESNVNRQLHAVENNYGKAKVAALEERVLTINQHCQVNAVELFIDQTTLGTLMDGGFDYVIDCIDNYRVKAALIAFCRRNKIPVITVGGAGGQTDPTRIRLTDLSRSEQDPLLAKCRKLLRKEYGFPSNTKRRFDIPCVYSTEQQRYPDSQGDVCLERPSAIESSLNCAGYGSVMTVTASFGLAAVSYVLKRISEANSTDHERGDSNLT
ncbi:MAG: tRNA cyclic N6-threonylcarbamoyladenosine(37) synthase TcdA [Candidatus Thiodiazotropha sp.]